jgi:hypothetical protein
MIIPAELFPKEEQEYIAHYPLAHANALRTMNGAVMCTLRRCCATQPFAYSEFMGGALYTFRIASSVADLFVLSITERVAMLRLRPLAIANWSTATIPPEQEHQHEIARTFQSLLLRLHAEIKAHLRAEVAYDDLSPLPPPANELDLVLRWRELYHPTMTNKDLASRIAMPYQTFRNKLSLRGQRTRVPRGAPRGEEKGRKEGNAEA